MHDETRGTPKPNTEQRRTASVPYHAPAAELKEELEARDEAKSQVGQQGLAQRPAAHRDRA